MIATIARHGFGEHFDWLRPPQRVKYQRRISLWVLLRSPLS